MLISICFTSKLNGALLTRSTTRLNATMLTTGRTSEENQTSLTTMPSTCARIGKQELSLESTRKGASFNLLVPEVMDGKSRNITHSRIRRSNVRIRNAEAVVNANIITVRLIRDSSKTSKLQCSKE